MSVRVSAPGATTSSHPARSTAHERGRVRRTAGPAVVLSGGLLAAGYLATVSPYSPGHYPTCPTLTLLGLFCPGCGALRAMHDVTTFDLVGAWGMNPFVVLMLPVLAGLWLAWAHRSWTGRPRRWLAPPWVLWGFLVTVLAYWVLRNVPALAPWLAPGGAVAPLVGG